MKKILIILAVLLLLTVAAYFNFSSEDQRSASDTATVASDEETIVTQNLEIPWDMVFLPNGSALITERPGRVRLLEENGELQQEPISVIEEVVHAGEGGLLGIEIHPDFSNNNFVYLYYTYQNGNILNKVVRYEYRDGNLLQGLTIIEDIPGASNHNGGRIRFGPDGMLYITTGDAQQTSLAQDTDSLAGKILRLDENGDTPMDNPFGNQVYSFGHRNPQGLVWDDQGRLWSTEHGPSAMDELNLIEKGGNYGWPTITGSQRAKSMTPPLIHSGSDTWAPTQTVFFNGSIFFTGLRGSSLYRADTQSLEVDSFLTNEYGRLRAVVLGQDGKFYLLTGNRDGRGSVRQGDDKIIRVDPEWVMDSGLK